MSSDKRKAGRKIRKILKLDKAWRAGGKQEGKAENALAHKLGQAYRAGLGSDAERARRRNAR